jgi:hypothetical protein
LRDQEIWWAECVWNDSETSFFLLCFCNCLVMKIINNNNKKYYYYYFPYQLTSCVLFALSFSKSSLLSMSKVRTLVSSSSSSSSSSCYRDCVLLSCIHSKRILYYFWVVICLCRKQIECEQGSN